MWRVQKSFGEANKLFSGKASGKKGKSKKTIG